MAKANPVLAQERPTRDTLLYFAGLFDGEGSITVQIACSGPPEVRARGRRYVGVFLELGMTTPEPVVRLAFYYGGSCRTYPDKNGPGRKPMTRWIAQSKAARLFLSEVGPYLCVKRPQAEIAMELLTLSGKPKRGQQTSDQSAIRLKQDAINRLRSLNGRSAPVVFKSDTFYVREEPT